MIKRDFFNVSKENRFAGTHPILAAEIIRIKAQAGTIRFMMLNTVIAAFC